jgi:hypothetical protein
MRSPHGDFRFSTGDTEDAAGRSAANVNPCDRQPDCDERRSTRIAEVFSPRFSGENFARRRYARTYEPGGGVSAGDSVVPAGDSDVPAGDSDVAAGDSIAAVGLLVSAGPLAFAAGGVVGAGVAADSVVSVFCSHAARSAAPASMEMYFFIVSIRSGTLQ